MANTNIPRGRGRPFYFLAISFLHSDLPWCKSVLWVTTDWTTGLWLQAGATASRPAMMPIQFPLQWLPEGYFWGVKTTGAWRL